MRYLVDSDVFLHDILHTERAEEARDFLDENSDHISTTILNLMEISSVLSRKYHWKKRDINKDNGPSKIFHRNTHTDRIRYIGSL